MTTEMALAHFTEWLEKTEMSVSHVLDEMMSQRGDGAAFGEKTRRREQGRLSMLNEVTAKMLELGLVRNRKEEPK